MSDRIAVTAVTTRTIRYAEDGSVDAADLALATRLLMECDIAVLGEPDTGSNDVEAMLVLPTMDREASLLVFEATDAVGLVWIENDATGRDTFIDAYAPPGPRAREVQDLSFAIGIDAARRHRDLAAAAGTWTARAGCWLADVDYAAAIEAHGFTPSRTFHQMRIASSSPHVPSAMPAVPPGVEIVVSDDEKTRRRIWAVENESFMDHYNFTPRDYDEWWELMAADPNRDPDGWWLLTVDGEDAGICLLDDSRADLGDGYVSILGVRKAFRGRGLAKLLLRRAFVHDRDLGRSGTRLGVDAENTTGAVRIYESVGMSAARSVQAYSLELD